MVTLPMTEPSDEIVIQFACAYAEAVAAYLTKPDEQAVFVNYSVDEGVFYWESTDEGIAGDDVDHLIMPDWQRHTGPIDVALNPGQPGYSHDRLCKAIEAAVLANGFASRVAQSARAAVLADLAEAREADRALH